MMIRPRPYMPYWPMYSEPERSRIEAAYRDEERKWQREAATIATLNLIMALIAPAMVAATAWAVVSFF